MIEINGQDGGGQILRSALTLSMITGKGFRMISIRGKRSKPGLMRQHLTCVNAALEVCSGAASGAEMHSTELVFRPGRVKAGDYEFRIGTAGSTTLLFQTVFPALMLADGASSIEVQGGTHNPMAPSADFIERSFLPQMRDMGVAVDFTCARYGFAPAGGGCIRSEIHPVKALKSISVIDRGAVASRSVECALANVRAQVGEKELEAVRASLEWEEDCFSVKNIDDVDGSGNALFIEEVYQNSVLHITSLGAMAKSAGKVAADGVKAYSTFANSKAAVEARLADQLLLPMALAVERGAGESEIKTISVTNHIRTNMRLIEQFIDVKFSVEELEPGAVLLTVQQG